MSGRTAPAAIIVRVAASVAGADLFGCGIAPPNNDASPAIAHRDLSRRNLQPEQMDAPGLDSVAHAQALAGLRRLNRASGTVATVWGAIRRVSRGTASRPLRMLDVASGGGDIAIGVWRAARRQGVAVEVHGIDFSPTAVREARDRTPRDADVTFEQHDALCEPLPAGYDVVTSTLFFHHLTDTDAVALLRRMTDAAGQGVVVSDLRRSSAGYWLARLACRTLSRSPIVHYDGPLSVEGAFTIEEFQRLASESDLDTMRVERHWPQRLLATWRRDDA